MAKQRVSASELLFPAVYRRKALALLLLRPEVRLHVREIARLTGSVPSAMAKELGLLHQAGLLDKFTVGNQVQFTANQQHPVYPELCALLKKTVGLADVLVAALSSLTDRVHVAFVFGSVARTAEHAASDIDILIIGDVTFAEVTDHLYAAQQELQREVNAKVYDAAEWKSRLAAGSTFFTEVLSKPKIFLIGTQDDLDELARLPQGQPA